MCMKGISRPLSEFPWRVQLGGGEDAELMRNQDGGQRIIPPCWCHHGTALH